MTGALQRSLIGVLLVGQLTLVSVLSVRATDPAMAAVGVTVSLAVAVYLVVRAAPDAGALALLNPAWAVALLLRRHIGVVDLLPLWAAQAVGALAAGVAAGPLVDRLPQLGIVDQPALLPAGAVLAVGGFVGTWVVLAVCETDDSVGGVWLVAAPVIVVSMALSAPFAAAANPAVLFGTGLADITDWTYVFVGAIVLMSASVLAAVTYPLVSRTPR